MAQREARKRLVGGPRLRPPDQPFGELIVCLHVSLPGVSVPEDVWLRFANPASPARRRVSRPKPAAPEGGPSSSATSPSAPPRPARPRPRPASTPDTTAGRTPTAARPAAGLPPRGTRSSAAPSPRRAWCWRARAAARCRRGRLAPGPPITEAEGPEATPAGGLNAARGAPARDCREKIRAGAIPRGGCRRGKE